MKARRRNFLIGGVALVGAGLFGIKVVDFHYGSRAVEITTKPGEHNFAGWLKIGSDDVVTYYTPHIDFGQGSNTALAQMLADELDADWSKVRVEQAPADPAFANVALGKSFISEVSGHPDLIAALPISMMGMLVRQINMQITGGSTAIRFTGQNGARVIGAAARAALIDTAANRLGVPAGELTTAASKVSHAKTGKVLHYGELAEEAAGRSLDMNVKLKERSAYKFIGKPIDRFDIPAKVDGSAKYGIDFHLPDMRVATIMAAPVREGKLISVDPAPAMAIKGVEKVIKLDEAVAVVATGYWAALKGLQALSPKFSDGGHGALTSASIFAAQAKLHKAEKADNTGGAGDMAAAFAAKDLQLIEADYRTPFLHQAMMEPFAMTAQHKEGKLEVWGGTQDPLGACSELAKASGLSFSDVTFNPMIMGGGFGRRFPQYSEVLGQIARIAMQVDHPVKLIWSREEEIRHGAYRPQTSAHLKAALGKDGKIAAWQTDYAHFADAESEVKFLYQVPATARRHHEYISNQVDAYFRSVNSTQHGFWNESFMDELAHLAGQDPYQFRRAHMVPGSRHLAVLDEVAKRSGWGSPPPPGHARGMAIIESFGTIVAEVVEASINPDGSPKVHKVFAVADCGTTVNPKNAEAQVQGGIIMGLSTTIGEAITLTGGAVDQSNFSDYPLMKLADSPAIDVHFIESDGPVGGLGEPGLPPAGPALANALFALTGKRVRSLPILNQAAV